MNSSSPCTSSTTAEFGGAPASFATTFASPASRRSRATYAPGESQFPGTPSAARRSCSWIHTSNARSRSANSSGTWSPSGPRTSVAGSRFSLRSWRWRRMIVYSSSEVISGAVW